MQKEGLKRGVAELLLIVVGVLVAFAVEAWWTDQGTAREDAAYLEALSLEFASAISTLEELAGQHETNVEHLSTLRSMFASGRPELPRDSVLTLSQTLWTNQNYTATMPAYFEFIASGRLTRIDNERLRRALFEFELLLEQNADFDSYFRSSMMASWEPTLSTRIPFVTSTIDLPRAIEMLADPSDLRRDLEFQNLIEARLLVERALSGRRSSLAEGARTVVAFLEQELGS